MSQRLDIIAVYIHFSNARACWIRYFSSFSNVFFVGIETLKFTSIERYLSLFLKKVYYSAKKYLMYNF